MVKMANRYKKDLEGIDSIHGGHLGMIQYPTSFPNTHLL